MVSTRESACGPTDLAKTTGQCENEASETKKGLWLFWAEI